MPAFYGTETSALSIPWTFMTFGFKHTVRFAKRLFYNYLLRDFNLGTVQGLSGLALCGSGIAFGLLTWAANARMDRFTAPGTVMLAAVPTLMGFQLLLSALHYDILSEPRTPLHPQL
jgi:hypothetical protein